MSEWREEKEEYNFALFNCNKQLVVLPRKSSDLPDASSVTLLALAFVRNQKHKKNPMKFMVKGLK